MKSFGEFFSSILNMNMFLRTESSKDSLDKTQHDKSEVQETKSEKSENDYKSKILEWSQQNNKKIKFVNIDQKGPDHKKEYLIHLYINEKNISKAWGKTIKSAEQKTSEIAYKTVS